MPHSRTPTGQPATVARKRSTRNSPAHEQGEFLRLSQEAGHVGSWEWDLVAGVVRWSPEMYRLHGRDPETFPLTLENALACYHPDDRARLEINIPRVLKAGRIEPGEVRVVRPDGEERRHWVKGRVERDASGRSVRMLGVNVDITEQRRAEAELRESEERYRRLSEAAFEGIVVSEGGVVVEANARFAEIVGCPPAELTGKPLLELVAPEHGALVREHLRTGNENAYECAALHQSGARVHVEVHGVNVPFHGRVRRVSAIRDISARKRAEMELAGRARQQAATAQLGLVALEAVDADALLRAAVPALATTLAVELVAVFVARSDEAAMVLRAGIGWLPGVVGHTAIAADPASLIGQTLATGDPVVWRDLARERRFPIPDVLRAHAVVSGATTAISGRDQPWGVLAVLAKQPREFSSDDRVFLRAVADLLAQSVERDHTAQALRVSEERYRSLVDDARDAIFGLAPDRTIRWANPAAEVITGWAEADCVGVAFPQRLHPDDAPRAIDVLRGLLQDERPAPLELRLLARAGGYVTLEFAFTAQFAGGRVVTIMGIGRDVTERQRLEAQLRQSQKMQSVGQLAGGVAHDFNNVLQAIIGFATIALRPGLGEAERNDLLEEVLAAALRGGDIARQLLTFSRQQPLRIADTDVGRLIASLLKMLRRLIGETIELRFACDDDLGNVRSDRAQIEQVIVNLCVNARDAMPEGGHIVIEARNRVLAAATVAAQPSARAGRFVEIVVTDTGAGMDEATRERIFEPFFTTKPTGKGTGLGLAVVYGIVQQHNGHIQVESEPGRGTEFHVFLPQADRVTPAPAAVPPVAAEGGTELILLAEDEPAVRRMVERVLQNAGYRVISAGDGSEALELFARLGAQIQLVVLDAVMPKVGGFEVYRRMCDQRPGVPALFSSGYSEELATGGARLPAGTVLLQKPYSMDELLSAVRRILAPA